MDNYLINYPNQETALACKRNGEWKKFSIQEYVELTNLISFGMLNLGIKSGDKVGIYPWIIEPGLEIFEDN